MQEKRNIVQIKASSMELAVKNLEINFKRDLVKAESISENTDVRLIPLDQSKNYILFISDNNISRSGDNSISLRVYFNGTIMEVADSRINNELEDCELYNSSGTEVINMDKILLTFGSDLIIYRIVLNVDMPLYLSGYNDYIDDTLEKVRFPMFSEKKFKIYSSLENVTSMVEVINSMHPNLSVSWK